MTWQNQQTLNWLLADKEGYIWRPMLHIQYIPNNTTPEEAFTEAMNKLKRLRIETATNAGRDNKMWDWFDFRLEND